MATTMDQKPPTSSVPAKASTSFFRNELSSLKIEH